MRERIIDISNCWCRLVCAVCIRDCYNQGKARFPDRRYEIRNEGSIFQQVASQLQRIFTVIFHFQFQFPYQGAMLQGFTDEILCPEPPASSNTIGTSRGHQIIVYHTRKVLDFYSH